jgi:hypothetical protein
VPEVLKVDDLAARWGTTVTNIYTLRSIGECPPAFKVGRQLRFRLTDVVAWEDAHLTSAPPNRLA